MAFLAALPLIGKIVAPLLGKVFDVVDQAVLDKDLAAQIKAQIQMKSMEIDHSEFVTEIEEKSKIVQAEATGHSWLQRNWRPITMMVFLVLVILDSFGWLPNKLAPQAWTLLSIGLGGYVVGRSAEKVDDRLKI